MIIVPAWMIQSLGYDDSENEYEDILVDRHMQIISGESLYKERVDRGETMIPVVVDW